MKERTYELTDYCPHGCEYCSSDAISYFSKATFLDYDIFCDDVSQHHFDRINLSGGEPIEHPNFYHILVRAREHADEVVVYTNALRHIRFNANVIPGIRVEANLTVEDNVEAVHVLKRVNQGRARPAVKLSRNWDARCDRDCQHCVMRPDGRLALAPCAKERLA